MFVADEWNSFAVCLSISGTLFLECFLSLIHDDEHVFPEIEEIGGADNECIIPTDFVVCRTYSRAHQ